MFVFDCLSTVVGKIKSIYRLTCTSRVVDSYGVSMILLSRPRIHKIGGKHPNSEKVHIVVVVVGVIVMPRPM